MKYSNLGLSLALVGSLALGALAPSVAQAETNLKGFGMIAYWGEIPSTYGGQIPDGAYVVINPNSGALGITDDQIANYQGVIANIKAQGGKVLGYVPTGYDRNADDELERYNLMADNIKAYSQTLGDVDGYFFDEAAHDDASLSEEEKCEGTPEKWNEIRSLLSANGQCSSTVVWNAGWPGMNGCFVSAANSGEHVVMYEANYDNYKSASSWLDGSVQELATANNVSTWLLIHSADQGQMKDVLNSTAANYVYVTSMVYNSTLEWGGPIWNYTPTYWGNEDSDGTERACLNNLKNDLTCE